VHVAQGNGARFTTGDNRRQIAKGQKTRSCGGYQQFSKMLRQCSMLS